MRWHNQLLIAMAVFGAVAATAGAAWGAAGDAAGQQVKGKVDNGTLTITGTSAAETLSLVLASDPTTLDVVDGSGSVVFAFDRSTFDKIVVNAGGGGDTVRIDQFGGTFTDTEATTLNGQGGDDTLLGGSFAETLDGGPGDDLIDGNIGSDVALMGPGNDTFQWDPGDGSDTVEGQGGKDTMLFNGSNAGEQIDLSANGNRLRLHRDVANVTMDTDGVENVDVNARGGADTITVDDLSATDVEDVTPASPPVTGSRRRSGRQRRRQRHRRGRRASGRGRVTGPRGGGGGCGRRDRVGRRAGRGRPRRRRRAHRRPGGADHRQVQRRRRHRHGDRGGLAQTTRSASPPSLRPSRSSAPGPGSVQSIAENLLVEGKAATTRSCLQTASGRSPRSPSTADRATTRWPAATGATP